MPKIFDYQGFRFFFFANEGIPREPVHVHARRGSAVAKFWIEPRVAIASSYGVSAKELNMLAKVVEERKEVIKEKWYEFFSE